MAQDLGASVRQQFEVGLAPCGECFCCFAPPLGVAADILSQVLSEVRDDPSLSPHLIKHRSLTLAKRLPEGAIAPRRRASSTAQGTESARYLLAEHPHAEVGRPGPVHDESP